MRKATVTVSYDEKKLDALRKYLEKKGIDFEDEMVKSIDTLYSKNVPSAVNQVYRKMPLISVHELFDLLESVKKILPKVQTPLLILHAKDDHTAKPASADFIFDNVN